MTAQQAIRVRKRLRGAVRKRKKIEPKGKKK